MFLLFWEAGILSKHQANAAGQHTAQVVGFETSERFRGHKQRSVWHPGGYFREWSLEELHGRLVLQAP